MKNMIRQFPWAHPSKKGYRVQISLSLSLPSLSLFHLCVCSRRAHADWLSYIYQDSIPQGVQNLPSRENVSLKRQHWNVLTCSSSSLCKREKRAVMHTIVIFLSKGILFLSFFLGIPARSMDLFTLWFDRVSREERTRPPFTWRSISFFSAHTIDRSTSWNCPIRKKRIWRMQTKTTKMMMTITNDKGKEMFFLVEKRESESLQRRHLLVL